MRKAAQTKLYSMPVLHFSLTLGLLGQVLFEFLVAAALAVFCAGRWFLAFVS